MLKWLIDLFRKEKIDYYSEAELHEIDQLYGTNDQVTLREKYNLDLIDAYHISHMWLCFPDDRVKRKWNPLEHKEW